MSGQAWYPYCAFLHYTRAVRTEEIGCLHLWLHVFRVEHSAVGYTHTPLCGVPFRDTPQAEPPRGGAEHVQRVIDVYRDEDRFPDPAFAANRVLCERCASLWAATLVPVQGSLFDVDLLGVAA